MMKKLQILIGFIILVFSNATAQNLSLKSKKNRSSIKSSNAGTATTWKLIFSDEFNAIGSFDTTKWTFSPRGHPAWAKYLTATPAYASQNGTDLVLRMNNAVIAGDPAPYYSGGIQTSGKFSFLYGKVEVSAKFGQGQGSWPAIWMMPELPVAYGSWPNSGEVDIMEHINYEGVIHQTIHNGSVTNASGGSTATKATAYNTADYNIYGIVWSPAEIRFYVNNLLQYTYTKAVNTTSAQWPFDKPFYILLISQAVQGGLVLLLMQTFLSLCMLIG